MASVRVAVVDIAQRLARAAEGGAPAIVVGYTIPAETIIRLRSAARASQRPQLTLRWAWRSQTARWVDTDEYTDGVAAMYLLAALLQPDFDVEQGEQPVRLAR